MQLSLKALRVNSGYTQQDVADIFEVSRQTVMNWENGKQIPNGLVIYAMAKLYKTEIDNIRVPS